MGSKRSLGKFMVAKGKKSTIKIVVISAFHSGSFITGIVNCTEFIIALKQEVVNQFYARATLNIIQVYIQKRTFLKARRTIIA